jgi:hypothetical protein
LGVSGLDILSRRGFETRLFGLEWVRVISELGHGKSRNTNLRTYSCAGARPLVEFVGLVCELVAQDSRSIVCERIRLRHSSGALIYSASLQPIYLFSVLTHA